MLAKTAAAESKTRARASMFGILLVIRMLIILMVKLIRNIDHLPSGWLQYLSQVRYQQTCNTTLMQNFSD